MVEEEVVITWVEEVAEVGADTEEVVVEAEEDMVEAGLTLVDTMTTVEVVGDMILQRPLQCLATRWVW